jgi:two-component system, chemotaxis family, sensor kinase CheA
LRLSKINIMDFAELMKDFCDDADGHLIAIDNALLSLERNGYDRDLMLGIMGALHTLKGNSGMMGFESLKNYLHCVEEMLKKADDNEGQLGAVLDLLFKSTNVVRKALSAAVGKPGLIPDLTEEIHELKTEGGENEAGARRDAFDPSSYLGTRTDTIKVDFKRLDELLSLAGELVIYKTRLNQMEGRLRGSIQDRSVARELKEGMEFMGKTISGLRDGIMRMRMLPLMHAFNKFPKMVRDIAKSQGKEVRLIFEGENTEVDKTIVDEIEEPLMHLIRNAIDHGIETPQERLKKGKNRCGEIAVIAAVESNYLIIGVRDDGRGISAADVRKAGIEKGLIREDDPVERERLLNLIFSAGFTTKAEAGDISGRGVGLHVVARNIARSNGRITVDGVPEKYTVFTMNLPLNLAIIPALMADVGGEVYAIPMSEVDESIKVEEEEIHVINNREVIRFRERVVPVVRLSDFFGIEKAGKKKVYMVILGREERSLALAVDGIRGKQDIVIKPLDDTFGKSRGIAGASILGNGRLVLIIDVTSFMNKDAVRCEE